MRQSSPVSRLRTIIMLSTGSRRAAEELEADEDEDEEDEEDEAEEEEEAATEAEGEFSGAAAAEGEDGAVLELATDMEMEGFGE